MAWKDTYSYLKESVKPCGLVIQDCEGSYSDKDLFKTNPFKGLY